MLKIDELNTPTSTFNKALDDEPIFVLKSTDPAAPAVIRAWIRLRQDTCITAEEKLAEAESLADMMEQWQRDNPQLVTGARPTQDAGDGQQVLEL